MWLSLRDRYLRVRSKILGSGFSAPYVSTICLFWFLWRVHRTAPYPTRIVKIHFCSLFFHQTVILDEDDMFRKMLENTLTLQSAEYGLRLMLTGPYMPIHGSFYQPILTQAQVEYWIFIKGLYRIFSLTRRTSFPKHYPKNTCVYSKTNVRERSGSHNCLDW